MSNPDERLDMVDMHAAHIEQAALAQHILKGEKKRRETDFAQIEDRIILKLNTLKVRLQHLTSGELEAVEGSIDCAVRLIDLFRRRNRAPQPPTAPERPTEAPLGPCTTLGPDKPPAGFDGSTGKRPLEGPDNSNGIGGDCGNCGKEDVRLYPYTTKSEEQTIDVCDKCLRALEAK